MGYLIILRGPAGSGKDTIGKHLVEKLGGFNKAYRLDLDITGPIEEQFIESLQKLCVRTISVVGIIGEIVVVIFVANFRIKP